MRILVGVNINPKKSGAYDIQGAYREMDAIGWSKSHFKKENINVGDIIYLFLNEPVRKIKYKCEVTDINKDPKDLQDDSKYQLNTGEEINGGDTCYELKKIKEIEDNERLDFNHLKNVLGWSEKATSFRGTYNDKGKCKKMFDYIDSIIDESDNSYFVEEFEQIQSEMESIPDKFKKDYIKIRTGQSKFRHALINKHNCKCAICGLKIEELLVASHIKEYSLSEGNEYIDINNGLLLCANHDKLFDKHFISFDEEGKIIISNEISKSDYEILSINDKMTISKNYFDEKYMDFHRKKLR